MKNYFIFLVTCFTATLYGQDLAHKIPKNVPYAFSLNSKNITNKVPVETIQEFPWMQNILEKLKISGKDLNQIGIDLKSKHYQYYTVKDSVHIYAFLIPLTNATQFEKLLQGRYGDSLKIKKQPKYSSISSAKNHHLAWNDKFAIALNTSYIKAYKDIYTEPYSDLQTMDSISLPAMDSIIPVAPNYDNTTPVRTIEEVKPAPDSKKGKKSKNGKKTTAKKTTEEEKYLAEQEKLYAEEQKRREEEEEAQRKESELELKKADSIERIKINTSVDLLFKETFEAETTKSDSKLALLNENDPKSDFFAYADLDVLTSQFFQSFMGKYSTLSGVYKNGLLNSTFYMNGYFEKDKIRLHQIITPNNQDIKKTYQEMFDSKINKNLLDYVGNSILGYWSISLDTQALMNYEYKVLKSTLSSYAQTFLKNSKDETDVLVDAIALLLDEKAIADLIPGNALFVLHDLKKVSRNYVSYTYNENYEQIENKGVKDEIQPNFSVLINTRNESFVNRLLNLPLAKKEITGTDYQFTNGYYTIHFEKNNFYDNIYFGLKNGVFIVTSVKENVENLIAEKPMPLQADFKKSISKNNSAAWLDIQNTFAAAKSEFKGSTTNSFDNTLKNAKAIAFETKFKNGSIVSDLEYTIEDKYSNSLYYFFDFLNEAYLDSQKSVTVEETTYGSAVGTPVDAPPAEEAPVKE